MSTVGAKERATQERVVRLLSDRLGYTYLGDLSHRDNASIDVDALTTYLSRSGYVPDEISRALTVLDRAANNQAKSLYERNREVYSLLRYGVPVRAEQGGVNQTMHLVDWSDLHANDFAVAKEVRVVPKKVGGHEKRPDIVVYLNGIAVSVIELKRSTVSVGEGIRQTLDNQKPAFIEEFFSTVQWVFAGNDTEGLRYATIQTPEKYWLTWKEDDQPANPASPLESALVTLLHKDRLLELLYDFVVFDLGVKKLPRPHQYFGVKAAQRAARDGRSGIIWHTQGSGKSLTMVWLARWIKENIDDARVLIITDRDELDEQIEGVFAGVGETIFRTKSGTQLLDSIAGRLSGPAAKDAGAAPPITGSLIHKFGSGARGGSDELTRDMIEKAAASLTPKGRFFVFVDEAHRTQSGILHDAMTVLLPGAVFFGFTGTPLLSADKARSIETFGPYIHTYRYDQAVADGVVLDLRYEARDVDQRISNEKAIDKWFDAKTAGLNDVAKAKLKRRWGTLQKLFSSRSRLEVIVSDIVMDFNTRPRLLSGRGNAILAAGSVFEACRYYELFAKTELKGKVAIVTSYDPSPAAIKGEEVGEGETESLEKNATYRRMLADWFHTDEDAAVARVAEFETQAKRRFIDDPGQMKLLIVVDKLLTGFDAPPATYLYIDKAMRDHGLFQAICRVNRLDADTEPAAVKDYGYIVDYKDLFASLQSAVADYTEGAFEGFDDEDVKGLLSDRLDAAKERLIEAREAVLVLCEPVKPPKKSEQYREYFLDPDGADEDAVKGKERLRLALYKSIGTYVRAWAELATDTDGAGMTPSEVAIHVRDVAHYTAVKDELLLASGDGLDLKAYEPGMRYLIDTYVKADPTEVLSDLNNRTFLELLASAPEDAVEKLPGDLGKDESSAAEVIEANVRKVIVDSNPTNPKYFAKMSELLEALILARRQQVIAYKSYLEAISKLTEQVLDPSAATHYPPTLTSAVERLLFDSLEGNQSAVEAVMEAYLVGVQDGWTTNAIKRRRLTGKVRDALTGCGLGDDLALSAAMEALETHDK